MYIATTEPELAVLLARHNPERIGVVPHLLLTPIGGDVLQLRGRTPTEWARCCRQEGIVVVYLPHAGLAQRMRDAYALLTMSPLVL